MAGFRKEVQNYLVLETSKVHRPFGITHVWLTPAGMLTRKPISRKRTLTPFCFWRLAAAGCLLIISSCTTGIGPGRDSLPENEFRRKLADVGQRVAERVDPASGTTEWIVDRIAPVPLGSHVGCGPRCTLYRHHSNRDRRKKGGDELRGTIGNGWRLPLSGARETPDSQTKCDW